MKDNDNSQKSTGLTDQTDTVGVVSYYPLNDLNVSRVSGQLKGAERVSELFLN